MNIKDRLRLRIDILEDRRIVEYNTTLALMAEYGDSTGLMTRDRKTTFEINIERSVETVKQIDAQTSYLYKTLDELITRKQMANQFEPEAKITMAPIRGRLK